MVFFLLIHPVSAQDSYSSSRTEKNKSWIDLKSPEPDSVSLKSNGQKTIYYSYRPSNKPGFSLLVISDMERVQHAGILISDGPDSLQNWYQARLSEILLEWIHLPSDERSAQIRSEQIEIQFNGPMVNSPDQDQVIQMASAFSSGSQIGFELNLKRVIFSVESAKSGFISVNLPNRIDFLAGKNKEKLDNELAADLLKPVYFSASMPATGNQIQRLSGRELFPGFYSDRFGFENSSRFSPAWDSAQVEVSIRTLFSGYNGQAENLGVSLTHHTYGGQTASYPIKISSLMGNLAKNSDLFVALEPADSVSKHWIISVIAVSRQFAHQHLLIVALKPDSLFNPNNPEPVSADLFTFIRTDNLKSLISGYRDKVPKYQILK
ncbi:MAG: hypothetical protein J0L62_12205 [Bacteroidetes bacterium]|nr:hypothetical protein [Bacteroidota bacterium]